MEYIPNKLHPGQTPATVQSLSTRFDQKGHERPFQKAIIVDIVDDYLNPGDKIIIRLGDRRFGARGTRAQTFVEDNFLMRWYIDPVGTSKFAVIKPDIAFDIVPGAPAKLKVTTPRLVRSGIAFPITVHAEDEWGNAVTNQKGVSAILKIYTAGTQHVALEDIQRLPDSGWAYAHFPSLILSAPVGDYTVSVAFDFHTLQKSSPSTPPSQTPSSSSLSQNGAATPPHAAITTSSSSPIPLHNPQNFHWIGMAM
jgi:hypothetical protein